MTLLAIVLALLAAGTPAQLAPVPQTTNPRIELHFDASEAEAVLAIVGQARAGETVPENAWQRLFDTRPYLRLKQREAQMHRDFSDEDFRRFVLSPELARRADSLRTTLEAWRQTDLSASARRILVYLPDSARIRASVYPVIKPKTNSFVFEPSTDAAIFLYLDPTESAAKFENTVAHEMHHIGFSSVSARQDSLFAHLPPRVRTTVQWMSAFGEGFAMLAAAGGPDVHPHATSPPAERERWDRDMKNFDRDLRDVEQFFLGILDGRLESEEEIRKAGFTFFGVQGPWYTVGYGMAALVERRYGRAALIECMEDPRRLLVRYNQAAAEANRSDGGRRALWTAELLEKVGAKP